MNRETPKVKSPIAMLVMTAIVIGCVVYLYWQVLSAYLAGGVDAPNLATVILSGLVLGAGSIYVVSIAVRIYLQEKNAKQENDDEKPEA